MMSEKIRPHHQERRAILYVRQSSAHQVVLHNRESSALQYAMRDRLTALGWCACRKLNPGILVMQSAQDWATKNVPDAVDGARDRGIFLRDRCVRVPL
jgi:hypothetical protein